MMELDNDLGFYVSDVVEYDTGVVLSPHFFNYVSREYPEYSRWLSSSFQKPGKGRKKQKILTDTTSGTVMSVARPQDHDVAADMIGQLDPLLIELVFSHMLPDKADDIFACNPEMHLRKEFVDVCRGYTRHYQSLDMSVEYIDGVLYRGDEILVSGLDAYGVYCYVRDHYPSAANKICAQIWEWNDEIIVRDEARVSKTVIKFLIWRSWQFYEQNVPNVWIQQHEFDEFKVYGVDVNLLSFYVDCNVVDFDYEPVLDDIVVVDSSVCPGTLFRRLLKLKRNLDFCLLFIGPRPAHPCYHLAKLGPSKDLFLMDEDGNYQNDCVGKIFFKRPGDKKKRPLFGWDMRQKMWSRWDKMSLENRKKLKNKSSFIGVRNCEDFSYRMDKIDHIVMDPSFRPKSAKIKLYYDINTGRSIKTVIPPYGNAVLAVSSAFNYVKSKGYNVVFDPCLGWRIGEVVVRR